MFALWLRMGDTEGFLLWMALFVLFLLRERVPKFKRTVVIDFLVILSLYGELNPPMTVPALMLVFFQAFYFGIYWLLVILIYILYLLSPISGVLVLSAGLSGMLLNYWEKEVDEKKNTRDGMAQKYLELESMQRELSTALMRVEQMTVIAERARLSRDIHDNAGHEIVAAYISFQTVRTLLEDADGEVLELYDAALERLNRGTDKIRESVHNLSTVTLLGIESLRENCERFSFAPVDFKAYGDSSLVSISIWNMLESCLNECLTNIMRHSRAKTVNVELDVTPYLVRLFVENDGAHPTDKPTGTGLRNLRHRAAAMGGSVAMKSGKVFSVTCVIPLKGEKR